MQEERKTPEMRAQMTDIERLRHSTAHVLATAILANKHAEFRARLEQFRADQTAKVLAHPDPRSDSQ